MIAQDRPVVPGLPSPPSMAALATATVVSIAVAAIVLVTAVLPAEYGIDPTGVGRALGLIELYEAGEADLDVPEPAAPATASVYRQLTDFRTDSREFTVPARGSVAFTYRLSRGASVLYAWKASAFIDFEFRADPVGDPPAPSDSVERGTAAESRGTYVAPYGGMHGWHWDNPTDRDVTITLTTAGFYQTATLSLPTGTREFTIPEP